MRNMITITLNPPPMTAQKGRTIPVMIRPISRVRLKGVAGRKCAREVVKSTNGMGINITGFGRIEPVTEGKAM